MIHYSSKWLMAVLLTGTMAVTLPNFAAEDDIPPQNNRRARRGGPNMNGGPRMMGGGMAEVMEKLKAQYPDEVAEIEELGKTDRRASMEKMRALMEKAGIEMPGMPVNPEMKRINAENELAAKMPEEYDALMAQQLEIDRKLRELAAKAEIDLPETYAEAMRELKGTLQEKNPDAMKEIAELAKSDRREAEKKLRELAEAEGLEYPKMNPNRGMQMGPGGRPEMGPGQGKEGALRRNPMREIENKLKTDYPDEWQEIQELRKNDREAAREKMKELIEKAGLAEQPSK